MGNFDKRTYDSNYAKQHLERCVFDVPKGARKPLQEEIKHRYGISLAEHVKSLLCRDLGVSDLSELSRGGEAIQKTKGLRKEFFFLYHSMTLTLRSTALGFASSP